jgi:quinone-modifying oxidoreductase subunit QmoA
VPVAAGEAQVDGGLQTDEFGFLTTEQDLPGMLAAGCAKRPIDVATCVRDATGAAMKALTISGE